MATLPRHFNHFDTDPAEYEYRRSGHLQRRRVQLIQEGLRAGSSPLRTVGELGCGTGAVLSELAASMPGTSFWGMDLEPKLIEYARDNHPAPNVGWLVTDASSVLPRRFDGLYSVDVLHHVADWRRLLRTVRSALEVGGRWIVLEPNVFHAYVTWQQESMKRAGLDEDHFRPWRLLPLLRDAGWELRSRRYVHLYPGTIKTVSPVFRGIERAAEGIPCLGASVVLALTAV